MSRVVGGWGRPIWLVLWPIVLVGAAPNPAPAGQIIYVDGTNGNDAWNGLCEVWDGGTCGPKQTIQAGINAAVGGDTVIVADGTYGGTGNTDLDYGGRSIGLCSAHGAASCTIECAGHRGFNFHSYETAAAVLDGFTIMHASPTGNTAGGAVLCDHSSPTIRRCIIRNCSASLGTGAALFAEHSAPWIDRCSILSNHAGFGAGLSVLDGGLTVTDSVIADNYGSWTCD